MELTPDAARVLGRVVGARPGPVGILLGAMHGNEPAGPRAIRAALAQLEGRREALRGTVIGLCGNVRAASRGVRYHRTDLNRGWFHDPWGRPACAAPERDEGDEAVERAELLEVLVALEREHARRDGALWVVDLHSTSGEGPPFTCGPDTFGTRALAAAVPVPFVLGLEESLPGSFVGFCAERGHAALAFEGGRSGDPATAERMLRAIWCLLVATGQLADGEVPGSVAHQRERLRADAAGLPPTTELRYRHAVACARQFRMDPGFLGFQRVVAGQRLAVDAEAAVHAPTSGLLLLPLYQLSGSDGFFLVTETSAAWLGSSRLLRRGRAATRLLERLPGISTSPARGDRYRLAGPTGARWPAPLLRLLGFRAGPEGEWVLRR